MEKQKQISIDLYVQQQLGALSYENIILKAQLDAANQENQELRKKIEDITTKEPVKK